MNILFISIYCRSGDHSWHMYHTYVIGSKSLRALKPQPLHHLCSSTSRVSSAIFIEKYEWAAVDLRKKNIVQRTSFSSSSRVNSFFLTTLSWLRKLNSAAFFWSLANLFSYLETFFKVGLTLHKTKITFNRRCIRSYGWWIDLQFTTVIVHLCVKVRNLFEIRNGNVSRWVQLFSKIVKASTVHTLHWINL